MEKNTNTGVRKSWMIPTRILCLLLAVVIWFFVVNITSDEYEKTYVVSIKTDGTEDLNEKGMSIYDISQTQVSITVSGTRSVLQDVSDSDFRAYVDVSSFSEGGKHSVAVSVSIPAGVVLVETSPASIDIYSDETDTRSFAVEAQLENYSISGDYEIGEKTLALSTVSVTGPASSLDKIEKMIAKVDLGNGWIEGGFTSTASLVPVDKNGKEVQSTFLTFSDNMTVSVSVNKTAYVPLTYELASGFDHSGIESVTITPSSVAVKGTAERVARIESLTAIKIDASTASVTQVNVSDITLPTGVEFTEAGASVTVTIKYKPVETTEKTAETTGPVSSGAVN